EAPRDRHRAGHGGWYFQGATAPRARTAARLAARRSCMSEFELRRALRRLPTARAPERDLWQGIAARIGAQADGSADLPVLANGGNIAGARLGTGTDHARTSDLGTGTDHARTSDFGDRKSTRLNSSHVKISYADFCLKKK